MKIDLKIFLILIFYFLTSQIEEFTIMLIFIFIHEMGHLLAGILLGLRPNKVEMTLFGFRIEFDTYKKNKILNRIIVDIAGPFVNLIILIIGIIAKSEIVVYSNLLIICLNLITIYPLDGARIMKNILLYKYNFKKANDIVNIVSNITLSLLTMIASIGILYLKNIAIFLIMLYLWYLNFRENKKKVLIDRAYQTIKEMEL